MINIVGICFMVTGVCSLLLKYKMYSLKENVWYSVKLIITLEKIQSSKSDTQMKIPFIKILYNPILYSQYSVIALIQRTVHILLRLHYHNMNFKYV